MENQPNIPPTPARKGQRWIILVGLALALAVAVGVGTLIGSNISAVQAASAPTTNTRMFNPFARDAATQGNPPAVGQGGQGQCDAVTVTSVNGATIVAKAADGTTQTIHTTASTTYTNNGQTATASTLTVGARIHVTGTHNSDGSITATQIAIG